MSSRSEHQTAQDQGQRQLTLSANEVFEQEVIIPAATTSFHELIGFGRMLFQQRKGEAIEPGNAREQSATQLRT